VVNSLSCGLNTIQICDTYQVFNEIPRRKILLNDLLFSSKEKHISSCEKENISELISEKLMKRYLMQQHSKCIRFLVVT
jgi:hypothetical protein